MVIETAPPGDPITSATRRKVRRYFQAKGPDWVKRILFGGVPGVALLGTGAWLGLPAAIVWWLAMIASMVFLVAAIFEERAKKRERVVDVVIASDFERAQRVAFERAQLKAADLRDPKCCAFLRERVAASESYGKAFVDVKLGKDERTRWTPHEITSVYVGHEQIWIHDCAIDLTTGAALYERTREVFFSDIASVIVEGRMNTRPMPPKHSKALKASKYWAARGGVVLQESLQFDGPQKVSLALTSGETLVLATWEGSRDNGQPEDAVRNRAAALRLRGWFEQTKRSASVASAGPATRATLGARQPRHQA
jgi:hypothetical protein